MFFQQKVKKFYGSWPFFYIELKAPVNYPSAFRWYIKTIRNTVSFDFFVDFCHVLAVIKSFPMKTLVKGYP